MMRDAWAAVRHALFNGNGLAKRLLIAVVAFSSLVTTLITAADLYRGYQRDLRGIDEAFRFIGSSYARSLSHAVWQFDGEAVRTQLAGLLRLSDIEYAGIEVDGQTRWSAGLAQAQYRRQAKLALEHEQDGRTATIGTLHVVASVDSVLARVWSRLVTELAGNAVKTLLVAVFLLLLFQAMVTQHLAKVARYVGNIDPRRSGPAGPALALDRRTGGRWRPDVLDTVVAAINGLLDAVRHAHAEAEASQRQLADSEMRFRLGMEASATGLWAWDLAQGRIDADEKCAQIVGLQPSALRPELAFWRERVHPDDIEAATAALRGYAGAQGPDAADTLRLELRLRHEQLGWRWFVMRGRVVERDAGRQPLRALGTAMDVDDRKRAETAVRASEARLRALTAHTSVLIYEVDASGRTTFANRGDDPPRRPVVGTLARDWYPPEQRERFNRHLQAAFERGLRQRFDAVLPDTAGQPRHYVIALSPIPGAGTVAVTAQDVTELKHAQDALLEANRQLESRVRERTRALEAARDEAERANRGKSEFLSRMSHELRTPMNAILGFAQLLEAHERSDKHLRWLAEIRHAGDHLLALIDELLDLARIEVGKVSVHLVPVDLDTVVEEAASMCRVAAAGRQIALAIEPVGDAPAVLADRTRLRQILVNLLSNAVKYNRVGGRVDVQRARSADGRRVRVTVSDTGPGIPRDQLARLFVPFERLGQEASDIPGSGVGLALSKRLAELMQCELGADTTDGQGARFWIELPVADAAAPAAEPAAAPAAEPPATRRVTRVLYIEDNPINLALMEAVFAEQADLQLLTAPDGRRGVALARSERPDLVLLDIQLPGMDGFEVLRQLRGAAGLHETPVIAVTASAMTHDVDRGKAAGFAAYVTKPFRFDELVALVRLHGAGR